MSGSPQRTLPHNLEAERSVLGSIILDADAYYAIASIIDTDDFYLVRHRWVFGNKLTLPIACWAS